MAQVGLSRPVDKALFGEQPELMVWQPREESLAMPASEVADIQLAGIRKRFADLRPKLPALDKLAGEQGIDEINSINEAASLLFKHSVYKSYPLSLIEKNRYDRLTAWLQNLTTADLTGVDTDGLQSMDEWLDALLRDAGVRILHSTGTSGKLSFLPRGPVDGEATVRFLQLGLQAIGEGDIAGLETVPLIYMGHRHGYSAYNATIDSVVSELFKGDESMLLTLYPGRLSADVLSLAGRLSAASNRGGLGRDQISPALLARREQFVEEQKQAPQLRRAFYDKLFERMRGQRIVMTGNWLMYHEMMEAGRERGVSGIFAPDSRITCAGGTKGKKLPDGFKDDISEFLGISDIPESYGMSEMTTFLSKCPAGKYHALPWMVIYLLDPETGEPAPREGTHTGRFGAIDLYYQARWGGILSGDRVTVTYGRCNCGRDGPFVDDDICRFSEIEGGDDKITCAGAPEAHDKALDFLAEMDG